MQPYAICVEESVIPMLTVCSLITSAKALKYSSWHKEKKNNTSFCTYLLITYNSHRTYTNDLAYWTALATDKVFCYLFHPPPHPHLHPYSKCWFTRPPFLWFIPQIQALGYLVTPFPKMSDFRRIPHRGPNAGSVLYAFRVRCIQPKLKASLFSRKTVSYVLNFRVNSFIPTKSFM